MRRRGAVVLRFALAVALALAALGGFGVIRPDTTAAAMPGEKPYVDTGKSVALALTTVDYRTVDRDVQRVLDNATDPFYSNFKQRSAEFTQVVGNAQSTSTGSIDEARLESFDNRQARVFVALTVTTTNVGQPPQPPRHWRLIITVVKVGDASKASGVEFMR